MSRISEWMKAFLILYFFLNLMLYLLPKESYRKYLRSAVKMILLMVLFLPLLKRLDSGAGIFAVMEELESYQPDENWEETERWEELQDGYIKERSVYYETYFGEPESSSDPGAVRSADPDPGRAVGESGENGG